MTTGTVDVESALIDWTNAALSVRCCTELPSNLEQALPIIEIGRIGGRPSAPGIDAATIDVVTYGAGRINARALAYRVMDAYLRLLPGATITEGTVTRVVMVSGPKFLPYANTSDLKVRRFGATYQVVTHATT